MKIILFYEIIFVLNKLFLHHDTQSNLQLF